MEGAAFFSAFVCQSTGKSHITQGSYLLATTSYNDIPVSDIPQVEEKATADYRQKCV